MSGWLLPARASGGGHVCGRPGLLFILMRAAPGDPLSRLSEDRPLSPREIAVLRARYGLDQPVGSQLASFLRGLVHEAISASRSSTAGRSLALLAERLPATLLLGGSVLLLNFTVGLWLGVRQAVRRRTIERTAGSPPSRSPATLCRRSGWGWCWPGWWASSGGCCRQPACRIRCSSADAGLLTRAVDVLRHIWCCRRSRSRS